MTDFALAESAVLAVTGIVAHPDVVCIVSASACSSAPQFLCAILRPCREHAGMRSARLARFLVCISHVKPISRGTGIADIPGQSQLDVAAG